MPIYRAVPRKTWNPDRVHTRHPGARLPANVPYFVDNLWEFTRPDDKPSRRHAVYASPTVELALEGAAGIGRPQHAFIACRVEWLTPPKMFQLSVKDARYHSDVERLRTAMLAQLAALTPAGLDAKRAVAPLFLPGLTRDELSGLMQDSHALRHFVEALAATVTLWSDLPDTEKGEWIFELDEKNSYTLHTVS